MSVNLFGTDMGGAFEEIGNRVKDMFAGVSQGGRDVLGEAQARARDVFGEIGGGGRDPFAGVRYDGGGGIGSYKPEVKDPFAGVRYGLDSPLLALPGSKTGIDNAFYRDEFSAFDQAKARRDAHKAEEETKAAIAKATARSSGAQGGGTGATYSGLPSGVAQWAGQTDTTFGDLGAWVPDTMLAIMINESGGSPTAYNAAGDAWGLFQQLHLNSNDPNVQFQAARKLAEEKLAGIDESYRRNGLNPDERTRALDLALAWAGHFDYGTGRMNPGSVDRLVGGQTSQQFADIFLANYDKVRGAKQAAPAPYQGTAGAMASIWGGGNGPITQGYGAVTPGINQDIYGYGAAYGLPAGHTGDDIGLPRGTQLYIPAGLTGVVETAGGTPYFRDEDYGDNGTPGKGELRIRLSNGDILIYGHTSQIGVSVGQQVGPGQAVARSGSANGDHLHLEVRRRNPDGSYSLVDPAVYFGGR